MSSGGVRTNKVASTNFKQYDDISNDPITQSYIHPFHPNTHHLACKLKHSFGIEIRMDYTTMKAKILLDNL